MGALAALDHGLAKACNRVIREGLTCKQLVDNRRVLGRVFVPAGCLGLSDLWLELVLRGLFILQVAHDVGEELVAVVLKHRRKVLGHFSSYGYWRHDGVGAAPRVLLLVTRKDVHEELGKCVGQPEVVAKPALRSHSEVLFVDVVVTKFIDGQEALEAGVQVAEVAEVLQPDHTVGQLQLFGLEGLIEPRSVASAVGPGVG